MVIKGQHLEIEYCPHCGINSPNLFQKWVEQIGSNEANGNPLSLTWRLFECGKCHRLVLSKSKGIDIEIYPPIRAIDSSITDARVKHHLNEALLTAHAPSACITACAAAVDAMLKARGLKTGSLYSRIDAAAVEHLITQEMSQWAHDIRLDANDQRHADESGVIPTRNEAEKCIKFAFALAEYLFVLPSKVERGRAQP